jgi:sec-independent protein translocase protein TatB
MEILGIGPGEFILILIVLLVVVGPERLPGLARQAGSLLVRARNWMQTSPDAALVLRARQEIEAELASIKTSLMEVQVVRDEVLGAARQLEDSVGSITSTKIDLNPLVKPPAEQTIAANGQALSTASGAPDAANASDTPLDQRSTIELADQSSPPIQPPAEPQPGNGLANGIDHVGAASAPAVSAAAEFESINIRLQAIMEDMWALQQQLKQRGALDEAWRPPSFEVQLPAHETAPLAGPEGSAASTEDEALLATRKLLEQLTPIDVAYHAPPISEAAGADSTPAVPARKTRKRRAASPADPGTPESAEAPASEGDPAAPPTARTRKRRATASAERSDETEPVTTEKAP